MKVKIKKLAEQAVIPKYANKNDAGLDLTATSIMEHKNRFTYGTALSIEIPEGYVGLIFPRSSIMKRDLRMTNCVGVIDSGYRGEIKVVFENEGMQNQHDYEKRYAVGDRIAQLIIIPYPRIEFEEVKELEDSERGEGGFGSSDTKTDNTEGT